MEAYALAKVCWLFDIPFISFKYITDGADEQSHEDWEKNLADGIVEFKEKVLNEITRNM
jgi:adenosylhomocysteine nucleosidase